MSTVQKLTTAFPAICTVKIYVIIIQNGLQDEGLKSAFNVSNGPNLKHNKLKQYEGVPKRNNTLGKKNCSVYNK